MLSDLPGSHNKNKTCYLICLTYSVAACSLPLIVCYKTWCYLTCPTYALAACSLSQKACNKSIINHKHYVVLPAWHLLWLATICHWKYFKTWCCLTPPIKNETDFKYSLIFYLFCGLIYHSYCPNAVLHNTLVYNKCISQWHLAVKPSTITIPIITRASATEICDCQRKKSCQYVFRKHKITSCPTKQKKISSCPCIIHSPLPPPPVWPLFEAFVSCWWSVTRVGF